MPETLAKRIVSIVLIAVGIPNASITEGTGLSDRSIWTLKKAINSGNIGDLFVVGHGSGRPGKAKGFEREIAVELERNNYHTRQQIADMILEKFGIRMSVSAVGKLLKKTASGDLKAAQYPQRRTLHSNGAITTPFCGH
jgi:transposase